MTNRQYDINGYFEIKGNPLSKVGVFEYLGADIPGAPKKDEIYNVLRPEEELSNPECIASFNKIPIIDNHVMLGDSYTPPEDKGVEGTTGDIIFYEPPFLKGDIKIFSTSLKEKIEQGKTELSCGYRCVYEYSPGEWNGQKYDYIQRKIRGNHIALVNQGRMGADVAVLDNAIALDHYKITLDEGFTKMTEPVKENEAVKVTDMTPEEKTARIAELEAELATLQEDPATDQEPDIKESAKDAEPDKTVEATAQVVQQAEQVAQVAEAVAEQAEKTSEQVQAVAAAIDPAKIEAAMDAKIKEEVQKVVKAREKDLTDKNALYEKVSLIVGAFDHSAMSSADLASYTCKKLGMSIEKGQEKAALNGFLAAYKVPTQTVIAQDSSVTLPCLKSIGA